MGVKDGRRVKEILLFFSLVVELSTPTIDGDDGTFAIVATVHKNGFSLN